MSGSPPPVPSEPRPRTYTRADRAREGLLGPTTGINRFRPIRDFRYNNINISGRRTSALFSVTTEVVPSPPVEDPSPPEATATTF